MQRRKAGSLALYTRQENPADNRNAFELAIMKKHDASARAYV